MIYAYLIFVLVGWLECAEAQTRAAAAIEALRAALERDPASVSTQLRRSGDTTKTGFSCPIDASHNCPTQVHGAPAEIWLRRR